MPTGSVHRQPLITGENEGIGPWADVGREVRVQHCRQGRWDHDDAVPSRRLRWTDDSLVADILRLFGNADGAVKQIDILALKSKHLAFAQARQGGSPSEGLVPVVTGLVVAVAVTVVEVGDRSVDHLQRGLWSFGSRLVAGTLDRAGVERDYPVRGCLAEDRPEEPVGLRRLPRRVLCCNIGVPRADERCLDLRQLPGPRPRGGRSCQGGPSRARGYGDDSARFSAYVRASLRHIEQAILYRRSGLSKSLC